MNNKSNATKKVTVELPADLLAKAQEASGKGITQTIRDGLQIVAAAEAYKALAKMRGKAPITTPLRVIKQDRE